MFQYSADNFESLYKSTIDDVLTYGAEIATSSGKTKELIGQQIELTNIANCKIDFTKTNAFARQRRYENYLKKELTWYQGGSLKCSDSPAPAKWKKNQDVNGDVQSNYGYIVLHQKHNFDGISQTSYEHVLSLLKKRPSTRQALIHYNLPEHYERNPKDIPCTVCTQVFVREDRLNFLVFQRSCDLYTGLPYDLPWHCYLMSRLVSDLSLVNSKLVPGNLTMVFGSLHIYLEDLSFFQRYREERNTDVA